MATNTVCSDSGVAVIWTNKLSLNLISNKNNSSVHLTNIHWTLTMCHAVLCSGLHGEARQTGWS